MAAEDQARARYELLKPHLESRLHRLWAAAEAAAIGPGGVAFVSAATGISRARISAGLGVLRGRPPRRSEPTGRKRGRQFWEDKDPTLVSDLEQLLADEIAGDPMSDERWVRSSTRKLRDRLRALGHPVGHCTVHRLLRKLGFTLRPNQKWRGKDKAPGADEQFRYIAAQRTAFAWAGQPVVSIDTKKKELIGNFRNPGRAWRREPAGVNDHDFTSTPSAGRSRSGSTTWGGIAGTSWLGCRTTPRRSRRPRSPGGGRTRGKAAYPGATEVLVLADCGGTNGHRHRAWKVNVQEKVCDRFGLTVTVCHYPPGCSKWNPIEHRLFSQVSMNWAGVPLRSLGVMLGYIRGTTTRTRLTVAAHLDEATYPKGQRVAPDEEARLRLRRHETRPEWNYTINPR